MPTNPESSDANKIRKISRRTIIYICTILAIVCICAVYPLCLSYQNATEEKQEEALSKGGKKTNDKATLHVAIMPTADCLPIYYAQNTGIFHQIGLDIELRSYDSQLDCDTALVGNYADCGWADSERLQEKKMRQTDFTILGESSETWQLIACGALRIKELKNLDGRTIAIARNTIESSLLNDMIVGAKLKNERVFRPLINDIKLRAEMLDNNQIDAAMLRWPYAQYAVSKAHKVLATTSAKSKDQACFVSNPPYHEEELLPPDASRARARHTEGGLSFTALLEVVTKLLSDKAEARFCVILPAVAVTRFESLATAYGLFTSARLNVFTTLRKPCRRVLLDLRREFRATPKIDELVLCSTDGGRSKEYSELCKDFYL